MDVGELLKYQVYRIVNALYLSIYYLHLAPYCRALFEKKFTSSQQHIYLFIFPMCTCNMLIGKYTNGFWISFHYNMFFIFSLKLQGTNALEFRSNLRKDHVLRSSKKQKLTTVTNSKRFWRNRTLHQAENHKRWKKSLHKNSKYQGWSRFNAVVMVHWLKKIKKNCWLLLRMMMRFVLQLLSVLILF